MHLEYVTGGVPSDGEHRLRVGAVSDLDAPAIPVGFDYVALGHLHRPQEVVGAGSRAHYAGSPIAYSFSEATQEKRAVLVDLDRRGARLESVPLTSGRPLEIWSVASLDEARDKATRASRAPIVDVRVEIGRRLSGLEVDALFALEGVTVASVRDLFTSPDAPPHVEGAEIDAPVEELFRELFRRRIGGEADEADVAELSSALLEVGRGGAH